MSGPDRPERPGRIVRIWTLKLTEFDAAGADPKVNPARTKSSTELETWEPQVMAAALRAAAERLDPAPPVVSKPGIPLASLDPDRPADADLMAARGVTREDVEAAKLRAAARTGLAAAWRRTVVDALDGTATPHVVSAGGHTPVHTPVHAAAKPQVRPVHEAYTDPYTDPDTDTPKRADDRDRCRTCNAPPGEDHDAEAHTPQPTDLPRATPGTIEVLTSAEGRVDGRVGHTLRVRRNDDRPAPVRLGVYFTKAARGVEPTRAIVRMTDAETLELIDALASVVSPTGTHREPPRSAQGTVDTPGRTDGAPNGGHGAPGASEGR